MEAKEQGWLGEVAAIEASLAVAEQKLAAMRDVATRHTAVHLGEREKPWEDHLFEILGILLPRPISLP